MGGLKKLPPPPPMTPEQFAALDHSTKHAVVYGVAAMAIGLSSMALAIRIYTRFFIVKLPGADDYLAIASVLSLWTLAIVSCVHAQHGLGNHIYDLQFPEGIIDFLKYFWVGLVVYNFTLFFIKLTLFFQYYRIINVISKIRWPMITIMSFVVAWTISQIFMIIFTCVPVAAFWDERIPARCLPDYEGQWINPIGSIVTDVIVLLLPLPVFWHLRMKRRQKIALIGVFSLGFVTCAISVLRLIFIYNLYDLTWDSVTMTSWTVAEVTTGVLCSTLPVLKPFIERHVPGLLSSSNKSSPTGSNGYDKKGFSNMDGYPSTSDHSSSRWKENPYGHDDLAPSPDIENNRGFGHDNGSQMELYRGHWGNDPLPPIKPVGRLATPTQWVTDSSDSLELPRQGSSHGEQRANAAKRITNFSYKQRPSDERAGVAYYPAI